MLIIKFLEVETVILLNKEQIRRHGGIHGVRDMALLESATYEPQATFGGEYLYKDIFEMAAAYAYGIIKNHPFIDGNKRTGIATALVFLHYNDFSLNTKRGDIVKLALDIATSKITLQEVAAFFQKNLLQH